MSAEALPFFAQWRYAQGLTPEQFWPRYGVAPGVGMRFEERVEGMPRRVLMLVALHRLGDIDAADLAWFEANAASAGAGLGAYAHGLRQRRGATQQVFWTCFGIAQPTGGRYERGSSMPPVAQRLLGLHRAGRISDAALARARRWLDEHPEPPSDRAEDAVDEAQVRTEDRYAIRWMDHHGNGEPGYLVILRRRAQEHTQWFGMGRYGSARRALAAAQRWRDGLVARLSPITKREFVAKVRRNNTSGVAGVSRVVRVFVGRSGRRVEYAVWVARPPRCLKGVSGRSFRVSEHGEDGARSRAVALRREFEAQVHGFHAPHVPEAFLPDACAAEAGARPRRRAKRAPAGA